MPEFTTLISGLSFTERPRWRDGLLYISDFYTHRVLAVAMDGTSETLAKVPQQPSGLGFLPDGRMLIVSMRDRKVLRRENEGSLVEHADLSALAPWHLNDMLVDHDGRAWVGNFGCDLTGGGCPNSDYGAYLRESGRNGQGGGRRARLPQWNGKGGSILQELKVEGCGVFACMLGGDDGRTLFACAAPTFQESEASVNHLACILMTRVAVPHAGLP